MAPDPILAASSKVSADDMQINMTITLPTRTFEHGRPAWLARREIALPYLRDEEPDARALRTVPGVAAP
jgi:hypothetical protein